MGVIIRFGEWTDTRSGVARDGASGQLWRRGVGIYWARSLEAHVLFGLEVQIRVNGIEFEQKFVIRDYEKGRG